MIKKIPAEKIGMTSAFDGEGTTIPVTLMRLLPVVVTEIKRPETHGYAAIQVAFGETHPKRLNKPQRGLLQKAGVEQALAHSYEFRTSADDLTEYQLGQWLKPDAYCVGWDQVKITGTSKGKGFAGAVKRYHFRGQQRTHGDPDNRRPMSNGATDAARVFRGSRRPGRMGNEQVSQHNTVFEYDHGLNILALAGGVPGPNGATVFLTLLGTRALEEYDTEQEG
jgi:large subunit ribosomal protein L3